jgi:phosphoglycolate phosphatase
LGAGAVLFDFDLTLIDSSYIITECTNLLAAARGLRPVTREEILSVIGLPIDESWIALWGRMDPEWLDYYRKNFREIEHDGFREFPGTREVPIKLREAGIKTGVVSNRRFARNAVERVGIADLFDIILGLEDFTNPKPHPEPILTALNRLGAPRERAVYVGDTQIDMRTAAAAEVSGLGVTTGNFGGEALMSAGARWVCSDLRDIPDTIGVIQK